MVDLSKLTAGKNLTEVEDSVLRYIIEHMDSMLKMGVRGVAKENYTSTSTIMRLTKKAGLQRVCGHVLQAAAACKPGQGQ